MTELIWNEGMSVGIDAIDEDLDYVPTLFNSSNASIQQLINKDAESIC